MRGHTMQLFGLLSATTLYIFMPSLPYYIYCPVSTGIPSVEHSIRVVSSHMGYTESLLYLHPRLLQNLFLFGSHLYNAFFSSLIGVCFILLSMPSLLYPCIAHPSHLVGYSFPAFRHAYKLTKRLELLTS